MSGVLPSVPRGKQHKILSERTVLQSAGTYIFKYNSKQCPFVDYTRLAKLEDLQSCQTFTFIFRLPSCLPNAVILTEGRATCDYQLPKILVSSDEISQGGWFWDWADPGRIWCHFHREEGDRIVLVSWSCTSLKGENTKANFPAPCVQAAESTQSRRNSKRLVKGKRNAQTCLCSVLCILEASHVT